MARCEFKACVYQATPGKKLCLMHEKEDEKKLAAAAAQQHVTNNVAVVITPTSSTKQFKYVNLDAIPKFRVRNEEAFRTAKAVEKAEDGHALEMNCPGSAKARLAFSVTVVSYCAKIGFKCKYQTSGDIVYFYKPKEKAVATR